MIDRLLNVLGICQHSRTTFPQSPRGRYDVAAHITCLECGREFEYDWETMSTKKVAQSIFPVVSFPPCLKKSVLVKP